MKEPSGDNSVAGRWSFPQPHLGILSTINRMEDEGQHRQSPVCTRSKLRFVLWSYKDLIVLRINPATDLTFFVTYLDD